MALIVSTAILCAVGLFALVAGSLGHRLLRIFGFDFTSDIEHLLCSVALGVISLEVFFFLGQLSNHVRVGIATILVLALLLGLGDLAPVVRRISRSSAQVLCGSKLERILALLTALVLLLEGLAAMAPLVGSDALHYHFTAPLLTLRSGFHPSFFLSHSFLTGQSHLLILAGLALCSSQLAMGFLFLGGVLAAAAAACMARRWTSREWSWMVALVFLLTPVVFWQISSAGSPDLWMAFFVSVGALVISQARELPFNSHAILAGALAGAAAGTKYTGCIVAAGMAIAYFWESRSFRRASLFLLGALAAGAWPYARNLAWTSDPIFPFLVRWISPENTNSYALASYLADTGAGVHISFWQILKFPFFAGIDSLHLGFWQFLGPLVLAFAPLLLLAVRNTPSWRTALTIWILAALGIGATSGMTRFLLPLLPIALAATLAGVAHLSTIGWRTARVISFATLVSFLMLGVAGLLVYDRSSLSVAVGLSSPSEYLRLHAPEYGQAQFVNQVLTAKEPVGNALVFLRHVYYLRVPFLYGDPAASWAIDPAKLQTPQDWLALFRVQNIRWVVRAPEYPASIAVPLEQLEAQGKLLPVAQAEISDFVGMRISGERQAVPTVILQVVE
jgi:hypothetical protein